MPDSTGQALFAGIDFGTSGARLLAINGQSEPLFEKCLPLPSTECGEGHFEADPHIWRDTLHTLLDALFEQFAPERIKALSIDGTSGTVLLCNRQGAPLSPALMYNDSRALAQQQLLADIAPGQGPFPGLARFLWLQEHYAPSGQALLSTQASWLSAQLSGRFDVCDHNNALKCGYDVMADKWPDWISQLPVHSRQLPRIHPAGQAVGPMQESLCKRWGLSHPPLIVHGTTDSTAAVFASGAHLPGEAITSLGSTLVVKVISERPLHDERHGVYSQPYGPYWLCGGASNTGGQVLRQFFSDEQLQALSAQIDPAQPSGLHYYPLPRTGERFPLNDPERRTDMEPRPQNDALFLQGLFEGMARIEAEGYRVLHSLGADYPAAVYSMGGGANNRVWREIRKQALGCVMIEPSHTEAAYGVAVLAQQAYSRTKDL